MPATKIKAIWNSGELVNKVKATGKPISKLSDAVKSQTLSVDTTVAAIDCGYMIYVDTDAKVITLPSTAAGLSYTIVNAGADGTVAVTISPAAIDKFQGCGITAADDKDLINTKATAKLGDYVKIVADGVDGWIIQEMVGIWARQA